MNDKKVLILECIPKNQGMKEGQVLKELLRMIFDSSSLFCFKEIKSKNNLLGYIRNKKDLDEYDFIHFSAHGSDEMGIETPNGVVYPYEFRQGCFDGKTITISACSLGNEIFAGYLIHQTDASNVIAPSKEVEFSSAAVWYVNFYYLVLRRNRRSETAYETCKYNFKGILGGNFQFFDEKRVQNVINYIEMD